MPIDRASVLGGRYSLEEVIGRGGMADVYRATDRVLGRPVAVKLLRDVTASEPERARFTAEARTLAKLNHAGLVTVLDAGTSGDQPYLVMELVDGPTLADCCSGVALDLERVVPIGTQLADALAYAHTTGIVHRDVKPANVLLGADGRVWLTDFGIARLLGDTARHTKTGLTIGSPAYLSPEQVSGAEVTPAADIYSLGLVLLEALTGQRAYTGSPTEAALARLSRPPAIPEHLPSGWRALLRSMTVLEPADRPTAAEVAVAVRQLAAGAGSTTLGATDGNDIGSTRALPGPGLIGLPEERKPSRAGRTTSSSRGPGFARLLRWVGAAAIALVLAAVLVAVISDGGSGGPGRGEIPAGVPPRLEEPLRELHDAVEGSDR